MVAALILSAALAACRDNGDDTTGRFRPEPSAGGWTTWVLSSPNEIAVPPPPAKDSAQAKQDAAAVKAAAKKRTQAVKDTVKLWDSPLPTKPWMDTAFEFVSDHAKDPPLSTRNYALLHVAMYDATIAAYYWKYQYRVDRPRGSTLVNGGGDPSYPSAHAAIAGAASKVLAYLYSDESALRLDEMADEAAQSRVDAGVATPSDIAAGLDLGRTVADQVIAYAKTDGAGTPWDGRRPPGIGRGPAYWEPPPGSVSPPIDPAAAKWKTWVMKSNDEFRPPPPPAFGSPEFRAAAQEIVDTRKNLTPDEEALARFYEGGEGTKNPGGITLDVNAQDILAAAGGRVPARQLTLPRAVRAATLVTIALADAGISAWDAKFTYWNPRPENAIRDLGIDPEFKPLLATPRFPAYPSGSAGYAGAAATVMTYLFPSDADKFKRRAADQARSRVLGGIHWKYDEVSLGAGEKIAELVIARAKQDGADKTG